MKSVLGAGLAFLIASGFVMPVEAQVPPSAPEIAAYQGLHKAVAAGNS